MADDTAVYLELVRRSPRPTEEQINSFTRFVSTDHSWYKHLPMVGRGEPFFFFLDPHVHEGFVEVGSGVRAWRSIVRKPGDSMTVRGFEIGYVEDDQPTGSVMAINYLARCHTAETWRERFGFFNYWNHGEPDQPPAEAVESARQRLRVGDDDGAPLALPMEMLELGLVYLRATVYPDHRRVTEMDPERVAQGLPDARTDREVQLAEMSEAMRRVVGWVYD